MSGNSTSQPNINGLSENESANLPGHMPTTSHLKIRKHLVDTAAKFLNMNNITSQPESAKRTFLEMKGLTGEEIDVAFSQSRAQLANQIQPGAPAMNFTTQNQLATIPPMTVLPYAPPLTFMTRFRDIMNVILIFAGVIYGFKHLYKYYIGPFLTGIKPRSKDEELMDLQKSNFQELVVIHNYMDDIRDVQESTREVLHKSLENIQKNILDQNKTRQRNESINGIASMRFQELTKEIGIVKSLLINKKSFPALPAISPSIPQWQKQQPKAQVDGVESDAIGDRGKEERNINEETLQTASQDVKWQKQQPKAQIDGVESDAIGDRSKEERNINEEALQTASQDVKVTTNGEDAEMAASALPT